LERALASHYHAVVWIDHHEARVIFFNPDEADEQTIHPAHPPRHLHHTAGSASGTHERGAPEYYRSVADAVGEAKEFLVAGPSTAKTEFVTWLRDEKSPIVERLCGVETLQHMSDKQLVADARKFFKGADRMRPRTP
jgi:hypothetical protein